MNEEIKEVVDTPKVETSTPKEPFKSFASEDDFNDFIKKEKQSHASKKQKELLDKMGVKNVNDYLEQQKKFKEWQESQMSETEKLQQELDNYKSLYNQELTEKKQAQLNSKLLKSNIQEEFFEFAKYQVQNAEDVDVAIQEFVVKNPQYLKQQSNVIKNTGTPVKKGVEKSGGNEFDAYFRKNDPYWDKRSGKF